MILLKKLINQTKNEIVEGFFSSKFMTKGVSHT